MIRKTLIATGVIVAFIAGAVIIDVVSRRTWEARVWSCYSALGSGQAALPDRLLLPERCAASAVIIEDIGLPHAEVLLVFRPPRMMWLSYLLKSVDYDSYAIDVSRRAGVVRAKLHHGSD
jgi:hypothetical protein